MAPMRKLMNQVMKIAEELRSAFSSIRLTVDAKYARPLIFSMAPRLNPNHRENANHGGIFQIPGLFLTIDDRLLNTWDPVRLRVHLDNIDSYSQMPATRVICISYPPFSLSLPSGF